MRAIAVTLAALVCAIPQGRAAPPSAASPRPVVVELFTSQGCSSCPPADAFLTELTQSRPDVLALAFHITYWDHLGWRDPFALQDATDRQRAYARTFGTVYTPQMVVDGRADVVGSDRTGAFAAIRQAGRSASAQAPVQVARDGSGVTISIGAAAGSGTVWLVGYDSSHTTSVGRGENGGRSLTESNIVRAIEPLGPWHGEAMTLRHAAPAGERLAVLVQADDGGFVGVGMPPHGS